VWGYNQIAGRRTPLSNLDYIMQQMKQCQDIMLHIEWDRPFFLNPFGQPKRHSVGLVGEVSSNEIILNNPWGGTIHVNPTDAANNTTNGTGERFTPYKLRVDEEGYLHIDFDGHDARIYECVMICPAKPHVVTLKSSASLRPATPPSLALRGREAPGLLRRYEYELTSATEKAVNGLAVALPGLTAENVVSIRSPRGWTAAPWYRGRDTGFDQPAPGDERPADPGAFTGIIWRTAKRPLDPEMSRDGFAIEVLTPGGREQADAWEDDPLGHAVVLREDEGVTTAWHLSATSIKRKSPAALPPKGYTPEPMPIG
jgi:hypothetical protein